MISEVEQTMRDRAEMYKDLMEMKTVSDYLQGAMGIEFGDDEAKNRRMLREAAANKYRSLQVALTVLKGEPNPHEDKGIGVREAIVEIEREVTGRAKACQFMTTIEEMEPNFENPTFKKMRRRHEVMMEVLSELKKVTA